MGIILKMRVFKIVTMMMFVEGSSLFALGGQQVGSKSGIYLDSGQNLMWQDDLSAKETRKNWEKAIDYCDELVLGGYSDWYLPNKDELSTLFKQKDLLKNKQSAPYWSSSVLPGGVASWAVFFSNGSEAWRNKIIPNNVRCVRSK